MSLRDSQLLGLTVFLRLLHKLTDHLFEVLCIMKIGRRETKQNSQTPLSSRDTLYVLLLDKKRRQTYCCRQKTDEVVSVIC